MKIVSLIWLFIIFITCCNTTRYKESHFFDNSRSNKIALYSENTVTNDSTEAIWSYIYNTKIQEFMITKMRPVDKDTLSGEILEKIINTSWPRVQIKFDGTSNDTAFLSIPDSEVLTQQMGTTGAKSFMISVTFSFTELKGINCVSFDFKEGDHGKPGVYTRN